MGGGKKLCKTEKCSLIWLFYPLINEECPDAKSTGAIMKKFIYVC